MHFMDCGHTAAYKLVIFDSMGNVIADSQFVEHEELGDIINDIMVGECPICNGKMPQR
jgi:hypothetical protein